MATIQKPVGQLIILIYLYDKKKDSIKSITKETKLNPKTAVSAISNLDKNKFVQKLNSDEYELTEKGKEVAKHLVSIEKILSE